MNGLPPSTWDRGVFLLPQPPVRSALGKCWELCPPQLFWPSSGGDSEVREAGQAGRQALPTRIWVRGEGVPCVVQVVPGRGRSGGAVIRQVAFLVLCCCCHSRCRWVGLAYSPVTDAGCKGWLVGGQKPCERAPPDLTLTLCMGGGAWPWLCGCWLPAHVAGGRDVPRRRALTATRRV